MSCLIVMSQKELHRLELIQQIRRRSLSVVRAAEMLDLSRSQVHRLLQVYDRTGADGLASKKRARPSNRRHSEDFRHAAAIADRLDQRASLSRGSIDVGTVGEPRVTRNLHQHRFHGRDKAVCTAPLPWPVTITLIR